MDVLLCVSPVACISHLLHLMIHIYSLLQLSLCQSAVISGSLSLFITHFSFHLTLIKKELCWPNNCVGGLWFVNAGETQDKDSNLCFHYPSCLQCQRLEDRRLRQVS